ncbi:hypothetical protein [Sphingomicrobium aestuariivivum]|uniref:hypothetical protein n=1 Tax=Sphingomicrobium aestuariivivum TaxID=1582356 RepID=UPI001FD6714E|nr:hypothetical protein [Sphingomicrobium aestuariivivum]MCJ8191278.1 hypothetical protein [Sphingomicrobium aestuariivivum]
MPKMEPELKAAALARLRVTLRRLALFSLACAILAVAFTFKNSDAPSIHLLLAVAILTGGSVLVATFLMALIFYSANSGHDAEAHDAQQHIDKDPR